MTSEKLIARAIAVVEMTQRRLPADLRKLARAVPVHYESAPDAELIAQGFEPDLLGLFVGDPYGTELSHDQSAPPQILLYVDCLWDYAEGDHGIFVEEVRITYLHELGHYFGWDEDDLAARGLD